MVTRIIRVNVHMRVGVGRMYVFVRVLVCVPVGVHACAWCVRACMRVRTPMSACVLRARVYVTARA